MDTNWMGAVTSLALLFPSIGLAQQACSGGMRIDGTITDPSGALIAGAQVSAASGEQAVTDATGHYVLPCIPKTSINLTVQAQGFTTGTTHVRNQAGTTAHINLQLAIAAVDTSVQVGADDTGLDPDRGAGTRNLSTDDVRRLADDPGDFIQQLQILASNQGGPSESTTFVVDGFQNSSALPPKNSISSIRINPDPYSPVYEGPTFQGGRVEIFTKPGADRFHGALFLTDSDGSFNATDPFSVTATPAGKRRYGFELSGPIVSKKSGFSLALERRDINEFNVVNATTLDQSQNPTALHQSVPADQRLWIASARGDMQISPKDVATISFAASVNSLTNQGVGALTLPEGGYSSLMNEYDLRFTNILTLNSNFLHETRIGYTWKRSNQTPTSTAPSLEVAGYFTGGGAVAGNLNDRERDLEIDDDVLVTQGKHSWKFGSQSVGFFVHNYSPDTFNGAYVFGGGSAPELDANNTPTGRVTTISSIEQYRRALSNLPGGTPTTYKITTGSPLVPFTQWRLALFVEDSIKLAPRLSILAGLRYSFQTAPSTFANFGPRLALSWAPDRKSNWLIQLRAGLFVSPAPLSYATEVYRLNGTRQHSTTVYSPNYNNPLTPAGGSVAITTINQFAKTNYQFPAAVFQVGVEHDLPHHWHPAITFTYGEDYGIFRTRNINAPIVADSIGTAPDPTNALLAPRPIAPDENIFEYQNSGHLTGNILSFTLSQHSYKRFDLNLSAWLLNFTSDAALQIAPPQSSYTNRGESSRPDWQSSGGSLEGNLNLPGKVQLSTQLTARTGRPYNITSGTDANGDGTFNDRPSYAFAPGPGVYSTPFGLLSANTVNGDVPRNLGTMPSVWHLFENVSRAFQLTPKDGNTPRTLTFNARASNLLNHTNTTAVETVLSPVLGQPLAAEAARRVELGVRLSF